MIQLLTSAKCPIANRRIPLVDSSVRRHMRDTAMSTRCHGPRSNTKPSRITLNVTEVIASVTSICFDHLVTYEHNYHAQHDPSLNSLIILEQTLRGRFELIRLGSMS